MDTVDDKTFTSDKVTTESNDVGPRERILQAALELFVKQGYFNTNVPDISKLSRCSVGSIYHHFLNKEEIAGQLYKDGIEKFREVLNSSISSNESLEVTVKNVVKSFLKFAEEHHSLARYLWLARHTEFLSDKVAKPTVVGFDLLGRQLTRAIKNGIRKGEIQDLRADVIWTIVFGIPLSYLTDWLDGYTTNTPSGIAPVLADVCWCALKGSKK